jgi:hypothetical protein
LMSAKPKSEVLVARKPTFFRLLDPGMYTCAKTSKPRTEDRANLRSRCRRQLQWS